MLSSEGRKRHLATDTLSNMLTVQVYAVNGGRFTAPLGVAASQGWEVCDQVAEKYDSVEAFSGD